MALRDTLKTRIPITRAKMHDQIDLIVDAGFVFRQTIQGTDITTPAFGSIMSAFAQIVAMESDLEDNATVGLRLNIQ